MFFGIGGYGIGIAAAKLGPAWSSLLIGFLASLALAALIALVVGMLSLRVRAVFFAMITLAVASFFQILASQLSDFTGGEDGINFRLPALLRDPLAGYYGWLAPSALLLLALLRIVTAPFARVLQSIRENEFRAEALGYRTVFYRTAANCLGALFATVAGALYALWLRYTGPDTTLSFAIMIDLLLMVVIGGMGTLYGAVIGATLFVIAQNYLQDLMKLASGAAAGIPLLPDLLHPDRWLLWLGVLFVVCVYWFPTGIVGKLRQVGSAPSRSSRAA